jgi:hypothetical protein
MGNQFASDYRSEIISDASLLPHEEKPTEVCNLMMGFLLNDATG